MLDILYLPSAIDDSLEIEDYLNLHSPTAADTFIDDLEERGTALTKHPYMYPVYEDDSFFRRMIFGDYVAFYSVDEKRNLIIIHRIFHHSRDIKPNMLG